jgi:hypothetical protein
MGGKHGFSVHKKRGVLIHRSFIHSVCYAWHTQLTRQAPTITKHRCCCCLLSPALPSDILHQLNSFCPQRIATGQARAQKAAPRCGQQLTALSGSACQAQ